MFPRAAIAALASFMPVLSPVRAKGWFLSRCARWFYGFPCGNSVGLDII
jgi:hypothetical protein